MHVFGILLLFGLGVMAVSRWIERPLQLVRDRVKLSMYPIAEVGIGIGLAWAVHFNMWSLWNVPMRADWIAVTLTGATLGGISHFFTEVLAMFSGLGRKLHDEAETIEKPQQLQRAA